MASLLLVIAAGCGPSSPYCLDPDSQVATPTGTRPLKSLKPGDQVLGSDGAVHTVRARPEWEYTKNLIVLRIEGAPAVAMTPNHVVETPDGPAQAGWLKPGDLVLAVEEPNGPAVPRKLMEVSQRPSSGTVMNLALDGEHFLAGSIVVQGVNRDP